MNLPSLRRSFTGMLCALFAGHLSAADPPGILNHQGRIAVNGSNFHGAGYFKFALVDGGATTTYWSSDGSSTVADEPTSGIQVAVEEGHYTILLGHAPMPPIPVETFTENSDVRLRTWFSSDGGATYELLSPDRRLAAAPWALGAPQPAAHQGAIYRWQVFSTYDQAHGWIGNDDAALFGGVKPSVWTDGNGTADQMSTDMEVLRTLFTNKGYSGKNAVVVADTWRSYSSTNGKVAVALFRVRNTTGSAITWTVKSHHTCYAGWGEKASIALNGASAWDSGGANLGAAAGPQTTGISVPANGISTVIFQSSSSSPSGDSRTVFLAFSDDCLQLPAGLEYVDDLDTATSLQQ